MVTCDEHPSEQAVDACRGCERKLCLDCLVRWFDIPLCMDCVVLVAQAHATADSMETESPQ